MLAAELAALERQVALDERDRAALVTRLEDRDSELQRALAASEHAEAALADATAERARREAESAAHEAELERLTCALDVARAEAGSLAASTARLKALLDAERERTHDLTARHEAPGGERDVAFERAAALDGRLERSHQAATDAQRAADAERHAGLALLAHAERLDAQLRAAGVKAADIPPSPVAPAPNEP